MKKFLTAVLTIILTMQIGACPVLAYNMDDKELEDVSQPGEETVLLTYDDRYSFKEDYEGYEISSIENIEVTSRKIKSGRVTLDYDDAVLKRDAGSDTDVIATGVGTAKVTLKKGMDTITVEVTVSPAPLTLMLIAGQSNAEGWCSYITGYQREYSIACKPGTVYSTYAPANCDHSVSKAISGVDFSDFCTRSNAADFVAESLTNNLSQTGKELEYPLNSLTEDGSGKTGIDSGLAYEWNQLTGDKVWVVNVSYGGSSITSWVPGSEPYEIAKAVYDQVYLTYCTEIIAGHYEYGDQFVLWLQGEEDKRMSISDYSGYFQKLYGGLMTDFGDLDGIGVISVRANLGSYTNSEDLQMSAPRIVQYMAGASADYEKLYVVSNANEQWVSDAGVASYFSKKYGDSLSYPMRENASVPKTVSAVHNDNHYSQLGHNENGLTAAEGLYHVMQDDEFAQPKSVRWRSLSGEPISKLSFFLGQTETVVPVADPVYSAKKITCSTYNLNYNTKLGQVSGDQPGDAILAAQSGDHIISSIDVFVSDDRDFRDIVGENYTDFYYYLDKWYYLVNGVVALDTNTVVKGTVAGTYGWWYVKNGAVSFTNTIAENDAGWWYIKNGKVDFSYYGVARNDYGWWRIEAGQVNFGFNGFAENSSGWWYLKGGQVQFGTNDVIKGIVNGTYGWWYVNHGQVIFTDTVAKNSYGWWRIEGGKVNFGYEGFAENGYGWWYLKGGQVQFGTNDVIKGIVNGTYGWWYVNHGQVIFIDTVAKNSYGWWYIKNGMVDFSYTGLAKNSYGWWYIKNGMVDFSYTGLAQNSYGWWYIKNGMVDFSYTGLVQNSYGWWYIQNGMVDFSYTGLVQNSNGWWFIRSGKIDFSYSGQVFVAGAEYRVVNGKVSL